MISLVLLVICLVFLGNILVCLAIRLVVLVNNALLVHAILVRQTLLYA
jgi:hypothetical protein